MRSVGLKALKNRLSEYVRLANSGETVLVTNRDQVVAQIVPADGRGPTVRDAALAEAVRRGWLTPPLIVGGSPPARHPVVPWSALEVEIEDDRAER